MERLNQADRPEAAVPAEKVDRTDSAVRKQSVDHAVVAEDLLKPQRSDEGRQDHREHDQQVAPRLPREFVAVVEQRQRQRDQKHEQGGDRRDREAVAHPFEVDVVAENLAEQFPVEADLDHRVDRADQKHRQKQHHGGENQIAKQLSHDGIHLPSRARRAASR